ncbi:hypothetical protein MRX96_046590 [Rhipicephalus microplus]
MAASSTTRDGIPARSFYTRKGAAVRDILERVAVGDDVSDFSDLSDSDEEEWIVANNAAPDDATDGDELDFFCSSASSCSTSGRNWEKYLLQVYHPDFSGTFSEPDDLDTSMELFRKLLTNDMLEMLVQQTNLYSTQTFGASVNTNISEVEQFL